ncbi:MAG: phytoene desaturase family protein [Bacteroidales bacterium]|jgi:phytoene desaturase
MKCDVAVIGAGVGGLATSILLAQKGYNVSVFEKNAYAGGRCGNFIKDGHRFDIGATMIMMPGVYSKFYNRIGRNFQEEIELIRMDPTYRISFPDGKEFLFTPSLHGMKEQIESFEKGGFQRFLRYMHKCSGSFGLSMKYFLDKNFYNMFDMINLRNMLLLFKVNAHRNHYTYISKFFRNEALRYIFSIQNLYIGQNPLSASAVFAGLPYIELSEGVWFPRGGMNTIVQNLLNIAKEHNVKFYFNSFVKEIEIQHKRATGILINDSDFHSAETVIVNADLPYAYNNLLPKNLLTKRMSLLNYTCSAFVFHWGMDIVYPQLKQHNLFISSDYKDGLRQVFRKKILPEEQTFYVHSPVRSDHSAAPDGQDSITAIVQTGHLDSRVKQDWNHMKELARNGIIKRLEKEGLKDFKKHIKFEACYSPKTWQNLFNLSNGAAFGSISHKLTQMGYFRPHNSHYLYKNLFFTGSNTQPGSGIPLVLLSAMLTTERILKSNGSKS